MGTMIFELPRDVSSDNRDLEKACLAGGPDAMPWPTQIHIEGRHLIARRGIEESGFLMVPWDVGAAGQLMRTTTTLSEKPTAYFLETELARGKVHQVRAQAAEWQPLFPAGAGSGDLQAATHALALAVTAGDAVEAAERAGQASQLAHSAGAALLEDYYRRMFELRHIRQPRIEASLACALGSSPPPQPVEEAFTAAFNAAMINFDWRDIEPAEGDYAWERWDELVKWAQARRLELFGGPLVDLSPGRLPDWLWLWDRDPTSIANFMCGYVDKTVKRYRGRIRAWQVATAGNWASVLGLSDDELLWLTLKLAEVARQADPEALLSVGIVQPWGEYLAQEDRTHSPFVFADTLVRSGIEFASLDLELIMGIAPRGSYCRDLLDISRVLDQYAQLGVPLRATLGFPSSTTPDSHADPSMTVGEGRWASGFSLAEQADWARHAAAVALCKPWVRGVSWTHFSDGVPHLFPHSGLLSEAFVPKPALSALTALREAHLR